MGGVIFNFTGSSLSNKADKAWDQMKRAEAEINKACKHMRSLSSAAVKYTKSLDSVDRIYQAHLNRLQNIVNNMGKTDWNEFTHDERLCTENSVLLVGLLYNMCKVQLVQKAQDKNELNRINTKEINQSMADAEEILASHDFTLN